LANLAKEIYYPVPVIMTPEDFRQEARKSEDKDRSSFHDSRKWRLHRGKVFGANRRSRYYRSEYPATGNFEIVAMYLRRGFPSALDGLPKKL
jgi:hypothetical protein